MGQQKTIGHYLSQNKMNFSYKQKILSTILIILVFSTFNVPRLSGAETPESLESSTADPTGARSSGSSASKTSSNTSVGQTSSNSSSQSSSGSSGGSGGLYSAIGGTATCSAGQILGRIIGSAVGQAVGGITNSLKSSVASVLSDEVPTRDKDVRDSTAADAANTAKLTNKTVGGGNPGKSGILSGISNAITSISWDSILYCIVNEIMTYITQSTIQWIKSGFNGNPVFVENIGAMFQQIGNREKSFFTRELQASFKNAQRIAVNGVRDSAFQIAEPFRQGVLKTVAGYGDRDHFGRIPQMSPQLTQNYNSFVGGNFNAGGGSRALMQVSQSNAYVYNRAAEDTIADRIARAQQIQQSQIVNGTQSFYKCRDGKTQPDGSCRPEDRIITTPAQAINDETAARGSMKYLRLSFAKDFDSIVTALVNQLVKIAINKAYEAVQ